MDFSGSNPGYGFPFEKRGSDAYNRPQSGPNGE
jgi:hypothetical protein